MTKLFFSLMLSFFLCSALILATGTLYAQDVGSLRGQVTDANGLSVGKAKVEVIETATGSTRSVETGADGSYSLSQLRPGNYSVRVTRDGFRTFLQASVVVLVATPTTLDVRLDVGAVSETVTVEAQAIPALNTIDATVGNAFDESTVKGLPMPARNPVNLLMYQPGVVVTGQSDTDLTFQGSPQDLDERDGVVNGVRSNQSNITLDGIAENNWENQAAFTSAIPVTLDSLQEFRVTTTNANATDGDAGGAQVALVTKSGGNSFHGNARWIYRTIGTNANDFFNNRAGLDRPKLVRNIPGGSFGGLY